MNVLKFAFGLIIITFLLRKFDFRMVIGTVSEIPGAYLITTLIFYILINLLSTMKISLMVGSFNKKAPFWKLFKDVSLSWALGFFIPGKVGELSLIYLLKEYKVEMGPSTAIVLLDKISGFIVLSTMSMIGFFMFLTNTDTIKLMVFLLIVYSLFFFLVFSDYGRSLIKKFILRKKSDKFRGFSKSLFLLIKEKKMKMICIFLLALLKWTINGFILYILLIYLRQSAGYLQVLFVSSIVTIISYIPITFNGLGLRESSAIALFNIIGLNEMIVLSSFLYLLIVAYLLAISHMIISIKRISRIKRAK